MIKLKRAYEPTDDSDGVRILVERLWPRGVSKVEANITSWLKEIAPSTELRKWYNHLPEKWPEFQKRYNRELKEKQDLVSKLKKQVQNHTVTFVFAAKDEERNSAVVLKQVVERKCSARTPSH